MLNCDLDFSVTSSVNTYPLCHIPYTEDKLILFRVDIKKKDIQYFNNALF